MCLCICWSFWNIEIEKMNRLSSDHLRRVMQDNMKLREMLELKKEEAKQTKKVLFYFFPFVFLYSFSISLMLYMAHLTEDVFFST
jgi:hypothetical protein